MTEFQKKYFQIEKLLYKEYLKAIKEKTDGASAYAHAIAIAKLVLLEKQ